MKSKAISTPVVDLRPLFALAVLCMVALSPADTRAAGGAEPYQDSLFVAAASVPFEATADSLNLIADQVSEINNAATEVAWAYADLFFSAPSVSQTATAAMAPAAPQGESVLMTLAYLPESLYETAGSATDFMAAVEMAPIYVITDALTETLYDAGLY